MDDTFDLFKSARPVKSTDAQGFTVYVGKLNGVVVYVGTTIQKPSDRFRWHRNNGKNFEFSIVAQFDNSDDMLALEFDLIKQHKPKYNKINHRKQNLTKKLTDQDIDSRKNSVEWCQKCLKRRVNKGYTNCYFCDKHC